MRCVTMTFVLLIRWWGDRIKICIYKPFCNESMVSLVLRQYMRGENGTERLVGCFFLPAYSNRKTKCQNYSKISRN